MAGAAVRCRFSNCRWRVLVHTCRVSFLGAGSDNRGAGSQTRLKGSTASRQKLLDSNLESSRLLALLGTALVCVDSSDVVLFLVARQCVLMHAERDIVLAVSPSHTLVLYLDECTCHTQGCSPRGICLGSARGSFF